MPKKRLLLSSGIVAPRYLLPLLLVGVAFVWLGCRFVLPLASASILPPSAAPAPVAAAVPAPPLLRGAGLPSLFSGNVFNPARVPKTLERVDKEIAAAGLREACKKKGMSRWILCREIGFKYIPGDTA